MKFREFELRTGTKILLGKNAKNNDELVNEYKGKPQVILHTASPGSPFCIIRNPSRKEVEEVAIFTSCFSHEWRKMRKKSEVHIFKGEQVIKKKNMKVAG